MKAIRGAVSVQANTPDLIQSAMDTLFCFLCKRNNLCEEDFVCIIISQTKDLFSLNGATALRKSGKCSNVPLFCVQEADTNGAMAQVLRILALTEKPIDKVFHVYLGKTSKLRPDLS